MPVLASTRLRLDADLSAGGVDDPRRVGHQRERGKQRRDVDRPVSGRFSMTLSKRRNGRFPSARRVGDLQRQVRASTGMSMPSSGTRQAERRRHPAVRTGGRVESGDLEVLHLDRQAASCGEVDVDVVGGHRREQSVQRFRVERDVDAGEDRAQPSIAASERTIAARRAFIGASIQGVTRGCTRRLRDRRPCVILPRSCRRLPPSCSPPAAVLPPNSAPLPSPAEAEAILAEVRTPGAAAVLVNVWATWCAPCREEFPDLLHVARELAPKGLRLVLVSVDFAGARRRRATFLTSQGVDFPTFVRTGKDEAFVDGLEQPVVRGDPRDVRLRRRRQARPVLGGEGQLPRHQETGARSARNQGETMIRKTLLATALIASFAASAGARRRPLPIGASIPMADVKMKNVDGTEQTLAAVKKPAGTLVVFTCNHCPFAKRWESRIVELGNAYAAKGIGVIAVNANDPKVAEEDVVRRDAAAREGARHAVPLRRRRDIERRARASARRKTPEAFLFDKDGKLVYHGTIDDNGEDASKVEKPYLKDALEAVLAGTGCGREGDEIDRLQDQVPLVMSEPVYGLNPSRFRCLQAWLRLSL